MLLLPPPADAAQFLFKRIKTRTLFQSCVHKKSSHLPPDNITAHSRGGQITVGACSGDKDTDNIAVFGMHFRGFCIRISIIK